MSISDFTGDAVLTAIKNEVDGGRLYLFSGPVPASADDPLDMDNVHTQIAEFTAGNDGMTGLTFAAPVGAGMLKSPEAS